MSNLCKFTKGIANIFIGLATISLHCSTLAADFPELKEQIDSSVRPVGVGTCTTVRTGTWLVDGGVVVVLDSTKFNKKAQTCVAVSHAVATGISKNPNMYYFNIHSKKYSDGVVRGQLAAGM